MELQYLAAAQWCDGGTYQGQQRHQAADVEEDLGAASRVRPPLHPRRDVQVRCKICTSQCVLLTAAMFSVGLDSDGNYLLLGGSGDEDYYPQYSAMGTGQVSVT